MAEIFVSHATADRLLIDEFVQLLEGGIGIRSSQIFCSSLETQGVPPGVDFKQHIGDTIKDSQLVIGVVSERFYSSPFCMCELGASWILAKTFIPILVPPVTFQDLRGVLGGTQCLSIERGEDLDTMHTVVAKLSSEASAVARWNSRKSRFLEKLQATLTLLPPVSNVTLKEHSKLKAELENYVMEYKKLDAELIKQQELNSKLAALKDAVAVCEVTQENASSTEQMEFLIEQAREALRTVPRVVREAFFYKFRHEEFMPNWEEWGDAPRGALENRLLRGNGALFWVNDDHPKNRRVANAVDALQNFLIEPDSKLVEWYEQHYDDLLDITSRTFWNRHQLLRG